MKWLAEALKNGEHDDSMNPIRFECQCILPQSAMDICREIQDVSRWQEFNGYGLLPGIEHAEYEARTKPMVGSRICVRNTDGSGHVEEILVWDEGRRIVMQLDQFTPPLSHLASYFTETWSLDEDATGTSVTRSFELYPSTPLTRPFLWSISLLFRRAISRHLDEMAAL